MASRKPKGLGGGLALLNGDKAATRPAVPAGAAETEERGSDSSRNHNDAKATNDGPGAAALPSSRTPRGGIIDALRREDIGGKLVMKLPLEDVLEHIENPRDTLGDLTGLAASLKDLGQLQPAVVVSREDFLAARPGWPAVSKPWVLVAGHRRRAALELAGIGHIEAVQMSGGDTIDDHLVMYAENIHRAGLGALEEARLFSLLADRLSQREIATRLDVSQSHVSKRLALLKLPQEVQDAITRDQVSVADALSLTGVPVDDQVDVWRQAQRDNLPISSVIERVERDRTRRAAEAKARKTAEQHGVAVIDDPRQEWGSAASAHRLYAQDDIDKAKAAGDLLAHPTSNGLAYYSATAVTPSRSTPDSAEEKKQRDQARKVRTAAAGELAATPPSAKDAAETVVDHMLFHSGLYAESLKLTHKWLGERVGATADSPYEWCESLRDLDLTQRRWVAWAMALAHAELRARDSYRSWGPEQRAYLHQLFLGVGYQPTPWEQARLDAIPASGADTSTDASKETDQ